MKDLFAKERAEFQARKTIKKEDDSFAVFLKPLLSSLKGDLEPLIKSVKGKDGKTPIKGSDYFTASEIQQIKDEIIALIPPGEKGKDGVVDYNTISKLVTSTVAKLPKPKDGKDGSPGRDAIVNTAKIVDEVLKNLPKTKEYLTEEKLEKILKEKISNSPEKRVVGYSSLSQLTDVILTGVPQDSKGNYILTPGGSGSGHTIEDEGTPLTQRTNLNFVGAGVTVTDDAGNDATVVTISGGGGGGAVDSVNGETGVVILTTDDISDTTQTNKWATASEKTKLGHISVTQAVDLDAIETNANNVPGIKTKTDFITVTQAVDLDTMESDIAGKVTGPASATDNAVARFDTTTGELIQNSTSVISDNGDITTGDASGNRFFYLESGSTRRAKITQEGANAISPLRISTNGSMQLEIDDAPVMTIADTGPVTFAQTVAVPDEVFGASWNGSLNVPTKNAVYDQVILKSSALYVTVGDSTTNFPVASYADIGAAVNAAYASLPTDGGTIFIQNGTYSYTTPIVFGTNAKIASLIGSSAAGTILKYTPTSGNAITVNHGDVSGRHRQHEIAHFTMMGTSSFVYVGTTNTRTSVGLFLGGANGCPAINVHDMTINGFGTQIETSANCYMAAFKSVSLSGGNGVNGTGTGLQGSLVHINSNSNSGERFVFSDCTFTDPCNSEPDNAIYVESSGSASLVFDGCSLDNCQLRVIGTTMTTFTNGHVENPTYATYGEYVPIYLDEYQYGTFVFSNNSIVDASNDAAKNFTRVIYHGVNLVATGNHLFSVSGQTIPTLFDVLYYPSASAYVAGTTVEGGTLTEITPGWAYTKERGVGSHQTVASSWGSGIVVNSDDTYNWKVGDNINALTSDVNGNITAVGKYNGRITPRTGTTTSSATPTINTDNVDFYSLTAQAVNITSFTTNLTGTPTDGQILVIAITGTGARTITWGASFEASTVALPATTVLTNRLDVMFRWNAVTSKWRCISSV